MNRRSFLRAGSFAAAAAAMARSAPAATQQPRPSPVRLGLASYTFRNFPRARVIQFMQQLSLTALNAKDVKDHLPLDPTLEAAALAGYAAAGIALHAVGTVAFTKNDEADVRSSFEYARRAGVRVIVAGDPDIETLPLIEKMVKEYDIRFAIHNHGPEDKIFHSPLDVLNAVGHMDPRMGCCIDVGHCERAGVDPVHAIHAVGPRLFNMHIKDLTDFTSRDSQVAVGQGRIPIHGIFAALVATGYKGFVDLEYEIHADDPMPGVTESFAYMRGVLAGMGDAHTV